MKCEKWSWYGKRLPSEQQNKRMMGLILGMQVLDNHLYVFGDKCYLQTSGGGSIGLKLTGS